MPVAIIPTSLKIFASIADNFAVYVRIGWLPMLIVSLSSTWSSLKILPILPELSSEDPERVSQVLAPAFLWVSLGLLIPVAMSAVVGVAIIQFVVRGDDPSRGQFFYTAFGASELRHMGVTSLIALILFLISVPLSMAVQMLGSAGGGILAAFGTVLMFILLLAVSARWLLAYSVAAMEDKIDLGRGWLLARPVFGKLVGVLVLTLLPVFLIDTGITASFLPAGEEDPEVLRQAILENWLPLTVAEMVINVLLTSVFFTAIGIFYAARAEPAP